MYIRKMIFNRSADLISFQKSFRILSIDGGGVRGLIPLRVLHEIETKTRKPISQLFDLIVGNSTGGIITLILTAQSEGSQPKYTVQEALDLYLELSSKVFNSSILLPVES